MDIDFAMSQSSEKAVYRFIPFTDQNAGSNFVGQLVEVGIVRRGWDRDSSASEDYEIPRSPTTSSLLSPAEKHRRRIS
jgi:hypothetical protein